jgi:hypothetical protein
MAGNIDKTGATYQWTIHDQPADTVILSGPKVGAAPKYFHCAYECFGGDDYNV